MAWSMASRITKDQKPCVRWASQKRSSAKPPHIEKEQWYRQGGLLFLAI